MSISKKLFLYFPNLYFNSSLLITSVAIALLSTTGCDGCGAGKDTQLANGLHFDLTTPLIYGPNQEAILAVTTPSGENGVARFKDFNVDLELSAVGSNLGNSHIKFTGYDVANKMTQKIVQFTSKNQEVIQGVLYNYLQGGEGATLEPTQKEQIEFYFIPDMTSGVESMKIKIKVTNNQTNEEIFNNTIEWQRSPYSFKIIDLDAKEFIKDNRFIIQAKRKDGKPVQPEEANNLNIKVAKEPASSQFPQLANESNTLININKGRIKFEPTSLQDGVISKEFTIIPGPTKQDVAFNFELYSLNTGHLNGEAEAVAKANYHPGLMSYIVTVNKDKLIGPQDKSFDVIIQGGDGQPLGQDEVKKIKIKLERTDGDATIQGATGTATSLEVDFDGTELGIDGKATKNLTIETHQQPKATLTLQLFRSDAGGSFIEASQKLNITWELGLEVSIAYIHTANEIQYVLKNKSTVHSIDNIVLGWEGLNGTSVTIDNQKTHNKNIATIPTNGRVQNNLPINWVGVGVGAKAEAEFKFTVAVNGVEVYQQVQKLEKDAPKITIKLKDFPKTNYAGETEKTVDVVFEANGADVGQQDLQKISIYFEADQGDLQIADGTSVKGLNIAKLLTKLEDGKPENIALKIDNKDQHQVTFKNIQLAGSQDAKANGINEITWKGTVAVTMSPIDTQNVDENTKCLVVHSEPKQFVIKITNTSEFELDKSLLGSLRLGLIAADATKEPVAISYMDGQSITTGTPGSLWDILQALGSGTSLLKGGNVQILFTIDTGDKDWVEFEMKLEGTGPSNGVDVSQKVKYVFPSKLTILTPTPGPLPILVKKPIKNSKEVELEDFSFDIQNDNDFDLSVEDLKRIQVDFIDPANNQPSSVKVQESSSTMTKQTKQTSSYKTIVFPNTLTSPVSLFDLLRVDGENVQPIKKGEKATVLVKNIPIVISGKNKSLKISVKLRLMSLISQKTIAEISLVEEEPKKK